MTDASTSQDHFDTPTPAADLQALGERLVGAWRGGGGTQERSGTSGWTADSS